MQKPQPTAGGFHRHGELRLQQPAAPAPRDGPGRELLAAGDVEAAAEVDRIGERSAHGEDAAPVRRDAYLRIGLNKLKKRGIISLIFGVLILINFLIRSALNFDTKTIYDLLLLPSSLILVFSIFIVFFSKRKVK